MDLQKFYAGNEFEAFDYLGCHKTDDGFVFRTWAPAAEKVSLIGSFSDWNEMEMTRCANGNFFEVTVSHAAQGDMYKYRIYHGGDFIDHADPFAFYAEKRPGNASRVWDLSADEPFTDDDYRAERKDTHNQPLNIYEMHFGSWVKKGEAADDWYTYRELAPILSEYLLDHHYNFVEIMPLTEYPADESWGYQGTGYFAPTARYGTPADLKAFVDHMHECGIGVLMDYVPVHFAVDGYGLRNYDGTPLFEYPNGDIGASEWGSCNFMHSRGDIRSFLNSSAWFWLKEYHFDGLRYDAVGNLIFWQGNEGRGENKMAQDFLRNLNHGLKKRDPMCVLCAEDSTSWHGCTAPCAEGGLGFDYKWDLGWMNDTLWFFSQPASARREHYHKLTFSMMYYYNDRYLLPLSHDEVVHGKKTIVDKMYGSYDDKFTQARAFYVYMYTHPGKKLNFMGNEIGQMREWDEKREQDWDLLDYPVHAGFQIFMTELSELYETHPALFEKDFDREGFEWVDCHQEDKVVYLFERRSEDERLLCVFNFSEWDQRVAYTPSERLRLDLLIDSCDATYGGSVRRKEGVINVDGSKDLYLPAYCARVYKVQKIF